MGLDMYLTKRTYNHRNEQVGYWRKANHIHKWFMDNCADGDEGAGVIVVEKKHLTELLSVLKQVKENCPLVDGEICTGRTSTNGGPYIKNMEPGKILSNPEFAANILPTQSGFFFGSTAYDWSYMINVDNTIKIIEDIMAEQEDNEKEYFDFDLEYSASW